MNCLTSPARFCRDVFVRLKFLNCLLFRIYQVRVQECFYIKLMHDVLFSCTVICSINSNEKQMECHCKFGLNKVNNPAHVLQNEQMTRKRWKLFKLFSSFRQNCYFTALLDTCGILLNTGFSKRSGSFFRRSFRQ